MGWVMGGVGVELVGLVVWCWVGWLGRVVEVFNRLVKQIFLKKHENQILKKTTQN